MTPLEFERRYAPVWDKLEQRLTRLALPKRARPQDQDWHLAQIPGLYREVCHHLALARDRSYPPYLVARLNDLVQRSHQAIYQTKTRIWSQIWGFVSAEFPDLLRGHFRLVLICAVVFFLPGAVLGALTYFHPELVYSVFDPQQVAMFEQMYNPAARVIGRERAADSDFLMFGYYIRNNVGISFQVFASGILLGVGSLFYLLVNGIFIGTVAGYLTQIGYGATFWTFVCGHGAFELTAIVISGVAGLKLGQAILAPGRMSRRQALIEAARVAVKIVYGVAGMLFIAAFIEAFWSSIHWISSQVKYSAAAALWGTVIYYFAFQGRTGKPPAKPHAH
jgi:uncharacterized membrane protein SpoIIM required for sporulation